MHRLCDRCCEYHDTNGGMVSVDDDAYCNECYEQMIEENDGDSVLSNESIREQGELANDLQCNIIGAAIDLVRADDSDGQNVALYNSALIDLLNNTIEYLKLIGEYDEQ